MRALLPLGLLALAACYTPRAVEHDGPVPYDGHPADWAGAPLEASIWFDEYTGHASFDLNRPAHVALFSMNSYGGLQLIYPAPGYGGRSSFAYGRHHVRTAMSPYRLAGGWGRSFAAGPTYILLIASEDPLDVDPFRMTGTMSWLNRVSLTSNPYVAMEALVGEVVRRPATTPWTTAMHVIWPMDAIGSDLRQPRYIRIQCASGPILTIPVDVWRAGYPVCPEQLPPPDSTATEQETGPREAAPKRPKPPAGWIATSEEDRTLREEIRQRRQLKARQEGTEAEEFRPYWRRPPEEWRTRRRPVAEWQRPARPDVRGPMRPAAGARPAARPPSAQRPSTRPEARPRPANRPEARPKPANRPEARPKPANRPQVRPKPSSGSARPAPARPKPKPTPPPKPDRPGGGGGGSGASGSDTGAAPGL